MEQKNNLWTIVGVVVITAIAEIFISDQFSNKTPEDVATAIEIQRMRSAIESLENKISTLEKSTANRYSSQDAARDWKQQERIDGHQDKIIEELEQVQTSRELRVRALETKLENLNLAP